MANTTAVYDRLDLDLTEVKTFLGIDSSNFDVVLTTLLETSKRRADLYLNNPFEDADGDEEDIPDDVKAWCLQWINTRFTRRSDEIISSSITNLGSATWSQNKDARMMEFSGIRHLKKPVGLGAP